jgi:mannosyl-oligosaccharide glucosidase
MAHVYNRLRANVQNNVLSNYHQTGYFWEHYDDVDGRGTRGHPFSGWTTLVLNIMAEI